mgnify:CR=1 FL=1
MATKPRTTHRLPDLNRQELNNRRLNALEAVRLARSVLRGEVPRGHRDIQAVIDKAKRRCDEVVAENDLREKNLARVLEETPDTDDINLSTKEAAALIGCSDQYLLKRIRMGTGHPPYTRTVGGRYRFHKGSLRAWIKGREIRPKIGRPRKTDPTPHRKRK